MNRKRKRNFSVNGKQQEEFGTNNKQQGEFKMNRVLTNRTIGNQDRVAETVGPESLSVTYPGKDPNNDPKERLHGAVKVQAEEKRLDKETLKNLDEFRTRFEAKIVAFRWGYGYLGREEKQILLKNIKMEGSGKLLKDQWFGCGKWTQRFGVGDVIAFDATLKDGKLQYPTKVSLIESADPKSGSSGTLRGSGSSGVQMEIQF